MSVKIKCQKIGNRNNQHYKIILGNTQGKKIIDVLGDFNVKTRTGKVNFARIEEAKKNGAKVTLMAQYILKTIKSQKN